MVIKGHTGPVRSVKFSSDGKHLITASDDKLLKIWSLPSRKFLCSLSGHSNWVRYANFSPDTKLAVSGGEDIIPGINELRKRLSFHVVAHSKDYHPPNHCSFVSNNKGSTVFTEFKMPSGDMQMMWPAHCVQGTPGCEFHPDLHMPPSDFIVHKGLNVDIDSYSAFFDNGHKSQTEMEAL